MSRVGSSPITIPNGVIVAVDNQLVTVSGSSGSLSRQVRPEIKVVVEEGVIKVTRKRNNQLSRALHGLTRSLIANMVTGLEKGWEKKLELVGVGYRASVDGQALNLTVGFSHPVVIQAPEGITFKVEDNTKVTVSGINKELVGEIAAKIRSARPPEPYQGKGIRYHGEYVRRKAGKAGKVGAAGAGGAK